MTDNTKLIAEAQSIGNWETHVEKDTLFYRITKALGAAEQHIAELEADNERYLERLTEMSAALERTMREVERQKQRADAAWEVIRSNYWYNHYDELNEAHTAQREAVEAILDPDWTPDFDTSNSTKYVGWLDYQRIRALRKLFFEDKLREGLRQSAAGEVHDLGSFAQHADEEE